ncbi:MAG: hypothetical protein NC218_08200 [Acetobacter sp.]|nr:hypothetical protein [Acetobacter sp.]
MQDETTTLKMEWYDLKKYKDEVASFVRRKRADLNVTSKMRETYLKLYKSVYPGAVMSDKERFTHAQEMFKVYRAALIESSLSGYSALLEMDGEDGYSTLKVPALKRVMTKQFKGMSLLERLSAETLDDWILKGEAVSFIKLKEEKEEYRIKQTVEDAETGEPVMRFTMKEGVTYRKLDIQRIDPLDFYVDALDYQADPRGCAKIIRSWISGKELLTSNAYPMMSAEDKKLIVESIRNGTTYTPYSNYGTRTLDSDSSRTENKNLEVLTYYGDYITSDGKVLCNIKAVVINNKIADLRYNSVNTNRIIYAGYKIDDQTHRSIAPLTSSEVINTLVNRVTDMFIQNLDDVSNPILLVQKGTITLPQAQTARDKRFMEYNQVDTPPNYLQTPMAAQTGLPLIEMVLQQNKNTLGLNQYIAGDTGGVVRTARESSILFQKANARMRVETDVFSYNFMLRLFVAFYAFNRELALAAGTPLDEIYSDPRLKISISTNASRADKEGELNKLLEILSMPIGQMIFSNLTPEQIILAVRYLMAKAELSDADNLLGLQDNVDERIPIDGFGVFDAANPPPQEQPPTQEGVPPEIPQDVPINQQLPQQM